MQCGASFAVNVILFRRRQFTLFPGCGPRGRGERSERERRPRGPKQDQTRRPSRCESCEQKGKKGKEKDKDERDGVNKGFNYFPGQKPYYVCRWRESSILYLGRKNARLLSPGCPLPVLLEICQADPDLLRAQLLSRPCPEKVPVVALGGPGQAGVPVAEAGRRVHHAVQLALQVAQSVEA